MTEHHHHHGKTRYVFSDEPWTPPPGHMQAHRDLAREFNGIAADHGRPAEQVSSHLHVQSRIAKHKGKQPNFNRPRVAPAKAASVVVTKSK